METFQIFVRDSISFATVAASRTSIIKEEECVE